MEYVSPVHIMKTLNVMGVIMAVTIIALAGIAIVAATAASLLLVQSASATTDVMTTTSVEGRGEEQEAVSSTTTNTTNNVSNAALGSLFLTGENIEANVNSMNETHMVISYLGSRIIVPPNATEVINATETGNVTVNIQPNGLSIEQGQGLIVTEDGAAAEEENATFTYVMLSRTNPDGTGSGTGVVFYSTNSTGQLAFLDNMVAIGHVEFSTEGSTVKIWEWKGGTLPFGSGGGGAPTMGEQEAVSSTTTTTNNVSNALLGSLFLVVEFERTSVNPVNETYIETTAVSNLTIIPPNATTTTTINATLTSNATVNILPNGLALFQGQSLIVTEGDNDSGTAEQENATTAFVDISRTNPDGTGSGTGVVFYSTNSTGQLAFLDNMVGISQSKFSSEGDTIRMWEWKGGTLPFETGN
jgi:hypothetical protein